MPLYEMLSGTAIAFGALLLIIPGFATDLVGILIIIPITRKILFSLTLKIRSKTDIKNSNKTIDGEIIEKEKDDT